MDADDWSDSFDPTLTTCDRCGQSRPCVSAPDPFIAEVHPEDDPPAEWWCKPCFEARKDDV